MQSIIFIWLALSAFKSSFQSDQGWMLFKEKHGKNYTNRVEEIRRYNIYNKNQEEIEAHNEKFARNEVTYQMGVNQFTDMTEEERAEMYLGYYSDFASEYTTLNKMSTRQAPDAFSYQKYLLPPLDQGKCGSCWAFSATAQIESQYSLWTDQKVHFSPQYVLDCSGVGDCGGGDPDKALEFMNDQGVVMNDEYPIVVEKSSCKEGPARRKLGMKKADYNLKGNETLLKEILFLQGPVLVGMHVKDSFFKYDGGVYSETTCDNKCKLMNHAVLLVGYGRSGEQDYWLVKNSWGPEWGEHGYFRIIRNQNNNCDVSCGTAFSYFSLNLVEIF